LKYWSRLILNHLKELKEILAVTGLIVYPALLPEMVYFQEWLVIVFA